jgi:transposase InsO family protein
MRLTYPTFESYAQAVALDRYSTIASLVNRVLTKAEFAEELERIAGCLHSFACNGKVVKLSRRTIQRYYQNYRYGRRNEQGDLLSAPGLEALKPTRRSDCGVARAFDETLIERAERLRREEPSRTTATVIALIRAEYETEGRTPPEIAEPTLARHLRKKYASRRALKREGRAFPRYERPERNSVWQADWSDGISLPDPTEPGKRRKTSLHAIIDDHSRYIVHAEFYFNQNLPCLEDCFRQALLKGGVPGSTYWDNGKVYHSRQMQLLAARLGMQVIFATPYAPEGKGKIERWFKTVQQSFYPEARRANVTTLEELNKFFWGWLEAHYHDRVHASLDATPRSRWEAGAPRVRPVDPASLIDLFLWQESRQVDKTGRIELKGNCYPVHEHLVGKKVDVRFDPFDLSRVRIYLGDKFLHVAEPYKLESRTYRKAESKKPAPPSPLASSERYRKHLSEGLQAEVDATLSRARQNGQASDCLTRPELAGLLSEVLGGRHFSIKEAAAIADFFSRNGPFKTAASRSALLRAVDEKGADRHLRFYLDKVHEARYEGGVQ